MTRSQAGETRVRIDSDGPTLAIEDGEGRLLDAEATLNVADGDARELDLALATTTAEGRVVITPTVANAGDDTVRLDEVRFVADDPSFGADARVYEHGYQSWSPTASLPVGERFPEEDPKYAPMMLDLAAPRDRRTSNGLVGLVGGDRHLTLGFTRHERFVTRFELDDDAAGVHRLDAVIPLEGRRLAPGESLSLPPLSVDATGDLRDGLAALADAVGDRMDARVPDEVPTGWCTWYHYFTDVTEADVRENLRELSAWGIDVDVVQLDDGYMEQFGDWRSIADGFDDLAGLADDVRTAGYTPGLWLAPFYAHEDSALVAQHPEWFVSDGDGDPVDGGWREGGHMYGLDTTHPEVQEWLRETFATVVDEWGFDYLKLDFLFAAALPGERHDPDATRLEAYRRGMEVVDEAVGSDTFVLGCGAPILGSVGLVDAMRVGPDVDPVWETPGDAASQPALKNAVRNSLNRQPFHRRLWVNDPDCQLVRETTDLTDAERTAFAALVATTGGVNVFSDRLAEIDDPGRRLLERSLPPVETGRVEGIADAEFPSRVVCDRPGDDATTVVAFNWADEPRTVSVDPATYDAAPTAVWDGVAGEIASLEADGVVSRTVPPHGAAVFAFPEGDGPAVVGDAATLTGGPARIDAVTRDRGDRTLSARVDGESVVFDPESVTHD